MTDIPTPGCHLCQGQTVRGIVLDHDYERDYQSMFTLEADVHGLFNTLFTGQLPIMVTACTRCGHLSNFVDPEKLRGRLRELGMIVEDNPEV
jgi:hypothetical protein